MEPESEMQDATTPNTTVQPSPNGVAKPNFAALSTAVSDFVTRRQSQLLYVDKTKLIASLANIPDPVFIARPRRFGKSLLCSTLEELFAHGTESFKGLAIEHLWQGKRAPVIKLSFANVDVADDNSDFVEKTFSTLVRQLRYSSLPEHLQEVGIDFNAHVERQNNDLLGLFDAIVRNYKQKTGEASVIIIDEYDALLNDVIDNQSSYEARVTWFSKFFRGIKGMHESGTLRFLYISGVSRYKHTGILSGFNNLTDLSFSTQYCTLLGYTEEEIEQYFGPYIEYGAQLTSLSTEAYMARLRHEYDGYCFANDKSATKVYNPLSVLSSFAALGDTNTAAHAVATSSGIDYAAYLDETGVDEVADEVADAETEAETAANFAKYSDSLLTNKIFADFWIQSGSVSTFLINFFHCQLQNTRKKGSTSDLLLLMGTDLTTSFLLPASRLTQPRNPYNANEVQDILTELRVAMILSGYYTIKVLSRNEFKALNRDYQIALSKGGDLLFLNVPNHEIVKHLRNDFWPQISSFLTAEIKPLLTGIDSPFILLLSEVYSGKPNKVITAINNLFVQLSADSRAFRFESTLRGILAFLLRFDQSVMDALPVFHALPDPSQTEFVFCPPYKSDTETQEVVPFAADDSDDTDDAKDTDNQVLEVSEEKLSPHGYADIFVATARMNLVFELKLDKSTAKDQKAVEASYDKKLNEALEQIKTRRYYDQFPVRDTWCYAVVFSNKTLRAERLAVFKHTTNGSNSEVRKADPLPPL